MTNKIESKKTIAFRISAGITALAAILFVLIDIYFNYSNQYMTISDPIYMHMFNNIQMYLVSPPPTTLYRFECAITLASMLLFAIYAFCYYGKKDYLFIISSGIFAFSQLIALLNLHNDPIFTLIDRVTGNIVLIVSVYIFKLIICLANFAVFSIITIWFFFSETLPKKIKLLPLIVLVLNIIVEIIVAGLIFADLKSGFAFWHALSTIKFIPFAIFLMFCPFSYRMAKLFDPLAQQQRKFAKINTRLADLKHQYESGSISK